MADDIVCPRCGTDDISGEASDDGSIRLTCARCGEDWRRQPRTSCRRCHAPDPFHRRYEGWQYDDPVEARDDTMASYDDIVWDEYRCRRCHYSWREEASRRPGRSQAPEHARPPTQEVAKPRPERKSDEVAFHDAMVSVYERAKKEAGYNATRFLQLVAEIGGLEAARQLLNSSQASDGFTALWERQRLDLSVEAHVLRPEFADLFTPGERERARQRLAEYGYSAAQPEAH